MYRPKLVIGGGESNFEELGDGDGGQCHNPDALYRLISERKDCLALIDSGAQMSIIAVSYAQKLGLKIQGLWQFIFGRRDEGGQVPFYGYVELNMKIPDIVAFNEDCFMLAIEDSQYGKKVTIQVGTIHIDRILDLKTPAKLAQLNKRGCMRV